jgi:hypothetical protein
MLARAALIYVGAAPSMPLQRTQTPLVCIVNTVQHARILRGIYYTFNS